jgi:hypothetical protein
VSLHSWLRGWHLAHPPVDADSTLLPKPVLTVVVMDTAMLQKGNKARLVLGWVTGLAGHQTPKRHAGQLKHHQDRPAASNPQASPVPVHHVEVGGAVVLRVQSCSADVEAATILRQR